MVTRPYPLTERQGALLRYIAGYQRAHDGVSPTFDEMRQAIDTPSKNSVSELLGCLEDRGHIRRIAYRKSAIQLLYPVSIPLAPDGAPLFAVPLSVEHDDEA